MLEGRERLSISGDDCALLPFDNLLMLLEAGSLRRNGDCRMDAVSPVIKLHKNDLPAGLSFPDGVAIDSETMGLNPQRDRLCVVQLSAGDGTAHLVQFDGADWSAPRLRALL